MTNNDELEGVVSDDSEEIYQTSLKIEEAIAQALKSVGEVNANAADYGRQLDSLSGEIGEKAIGSEVHDLVGRLMAETKRMRERNQQLENKMRTSSKEITNLREELADAREEAFTDGLTGVPNRKRFDDKLRHEIRESGDTDTPLSLLMVDIDYFKKFNDTYGHQLGDNVLVLVARALSENVKGRDTVARYGGEEFSIILPRTPLAGAISLADHLRQGVASKRVTRKRTGETLAAITLSIGAARHREGEPRESLIERADKVYLPANGRGTSTHQAADLTKRFTRFLKPVNLITLVNVELIILASHGNSGSYRCCTSYVNLRPSTQRKIKDEIGCCPRRISTAMGRQRRATEESRGVVRVVGPSY